MVELMFPVYLHFEGTMIMVRNIFRMLVMLALAIRSAIWKFRLHPDARRSLGGSENTRQASFSAL